MGRRWMNTSSGELDASLVRVMRRPSTRTRGAEKRLHRRLKGVCHRKSWVEALLKTRRQSWREHALHWLLHGYAEPREVLATFRRRRHCGRRFAETATDREWDSVFVEEVRRNKMDRSATGKSHVGAFHFFLTFAIVQQKLYDYVD